MQPWFIAITKFPLDCNESWEKYINWSGLDQLDEVVSLDFMLCPPVLQTIKDEYWPHIVNEDFSLNFFVDLDFLLRELELANVTDYSLLRVLRNPQSEPEPSAGPNTFEFLGYDLIEVNGGISALTNCGGFPLAFSNGELSSKGLLPSLARALEVQENLLAYYPSEPHANCHVWSISRATF